MAIPGSGPISMSMFNVELGRVSNTSNSSLAGGSTPAVGSLFYLANQSGSLNQTSPHAMSEWYGYSITTTTTSGCIYTPFLGYDSTYYYNACYYDIVVNRYSDTGDLGTATALYGNASCTTSAIGGWYSDAAIARYWDGSSFTGFSELCAPL